MLHKNRILWRLCYLSARKSETFFRAFSHKETIFWTACSCEVKYNTKSLRMQVTLQNQQFIINAIHITRSTNYHECKSNYKMEIFRKRHLIDTVYIIFVPQLHLDKYWHVLTSHGGHLRSLVFSFPTTAQ